MGIYFLFLQKIANTNKEILLLSSVQEDKIRNENAEDLKNRILKLAKVDPDIGLRFLE